MHALEQYRVRETMGSSNMKVASGEVRKRMYLLHKKFPKRQDSIQSKKSTKYAWIDK